MGRKLRLWFLEEEEMRKKGGGAERGGRRERGRAGGGVPFPEAAGWSRGWAELWAPSPGMLLGCAGGWHRGSSGGRHLSCVRFHLPKACSKLPCFTSPCTSSPCNPPSAPRYPQPGKIQSVNKSSRLLRDEGRGMETVWGPDISLMCNNLVMRSFPFPGAFINISY